VRIAFLGLPLAAALLARDGHELAYAGLVPGIGLRRVRTRLAPGRTHRMPDLTSERAVAEVREARPELVVSWFWTKPVPPSVLAIAPAVGVHPSLLPRHRGPDPYFWAIDAGDEATGVTAHRLEEEYDTGPILAQRTLRIDPLWDAWKLARALDRPSLALLREVVGAYAAGRAPREVAQDEAEATAAPRPSEEDLAIRWTWPAARIERRVRAAAPWPGVWTEIGDEIVVLERARVTGDYPRALAPGEAAVRADGVAVVRAGEGAVELLAGRSEDDETPLGAGDFARIVARARGEPGSDPR
jgi:methionyl-tRNA formyltransferase